MAKAKTEAKTEAPKSEVKPEAPKSEPAAEKIGLSEAIREGFKALPESVDSGNRDATAALKKWITDTHPHLAEVVESATFGSTLSGQRKKAAGGETPTTPKTTRAAVVVNTEPTFPEVMKAKELCGELKLTPEKVLTLLEALAAFGDAEKLKKALNYAKELKG